MAINSLWVLVGLGCLAAAPVWSREAASPSACQVASAQPPVSDAKAALAANPDDVRAGVALADAWSDAGCFNESLQVLQTVAGAHPGNKELDTRLRVARSLVGEEHFFDNLDRADAEAKLKRASFRCNTLYDLESCSDALKLKPDDPTLLVSQGDALMRAKRPADALNRYRLALVVAPNQREVTAKIQAAQGQLPEQPTGTAGARVAQTGRAPSGTPAGQAPRTGAAPALRLATATTASPSPAGHRFSNAAPETQSH